MFTCQHVYCQLCFNRIQERGRTGHYAICKCGDVLARSVANNRLCCHPVSYVEFRLTDRFQADAILWDEDLLSLPGQKIGEICQKCRLSAYLRILTEQFAKEVMLDPFPGQVYACAEVNGYVVHGMLGPEEKTADLMEDMEVPRDWKVLEKLADDAAGILGQCTMEKHFKPLGDIRVTFRARGWVSWARNNQSRLMPLISDTKKQ